MGIEEAKIHRIYQCDNDLCKAKVSYHEKVKDDWRKVCPFCKKHSLYLDSAVSSISVMVDTKSPRTLGMIGQANSARREREQGIEKKKTPFWRKNRKVNFNVLKNPTNYVETGSV